MQPCQSSGQPSVRTSSRGSPKGRSNAPNHWAWRRPKAHASRVSKRSKRSSRSTPAARLPQAFTMVLRLLGLLEKSQPNKGRAAKACAGPSDAAGKCAQARPMMDAVAISSSSSASDTRPETAYGSSSGRSAYLSRMLWLILDILTWPMVQLPKRRSSISS